MQARSKLFAVGMLAAASLLAQDGATVVPSEGPPTSAYQSVYIYGSGNLTAVCTARSALATRTAQVAIGGVSKAAAAVVTSTGHGLVANSRPRVTIAGATGTGWAAINGSFTATVIDTNTFSIPVDSQAFGTLGGTVKFTTTAPRTTVAEWAVEKLEYDTGVLIWKGWQNGTSALAGKCSEATLATTNQQ